MFHYLVLNYLRIGKRLKRSLSPSFCGMRTSIIIACFNFFSFAQVINNELSRHAQTLIIKSGLYIWLYLTCFFVKQLRFFYLLVPQCYLCYCYIFYTWYVYFACLHGIFLWPISFSLFPFRVLRTLFYFFKGGGWYMIWRFIWRALRRSSSLSDCLVRVQTSRDREV